MDPSDPFRPEHSGPRLTLSYFPDGPRVCIGAFFSQFEPCLFLLVLGLFRPPRKAGASSFFVVRFVQKEPTRMFPALISVRGPSRPLPLSPITNGNDVPIVQSLATWVRGSLGFFLLLATSWRPRRFLFFFPTCCGRKSFCGLKVPSPPLVRSRAPFSPGVAPPL